MHPRAIFLYSFKKKKKNVREKRKGIKNILS